MIYECKNKEEFENITSNLKKLSKEVSIGFIEKYLVKAKNLRFYELVCLLENKDPKIFKIKTETRKSIIKDVTVIKFEKEKISIIKEFGKLKYAKYASKIINLYNDNLKNLYDCRSSQIAMSDLENLPTSFACADLDFVLNMEIEQGDFQRIYIKEYLDEIFNNNPKAEIDKRILKLFNYKSNQNKNFKIELEVDKENHYFCRDIKEYEDLEKQFKKQFKELSYQDIEEILDYENIEYIPFYKILFLLLKIDPKCFYYKFKLEQRMDNLTIDANNIYSISFNNNIINLKVFNEKIFSYATLFLEKNNLLVSSNSNAFVSSIRSFQQIYDFGIYTNFINHLPKKYKDENIIKLLDVKNKQDASNLCNDKPKVSGQDNEKEILAIMRFIYNALESADKHKLTPKALAKLVHNSKVVTKANKEYVSLETIEKKITKENLTFYEDLNHEKYDKDGKLIKISGKIQFKYRILNFNI